MQALVAWAVVAAVVALVAASRKRRTAEPNGTTAPPPEPLTRTPAEPVPEPPPLEATATQTPEPPSSAPATSPTAGSTTVTRAATQTRRRFNKGDRVRFREFWDRPEAHLEGRVESWMWKDGWVYFVRRDRNAPYHAGKLFASTEDMLEPVP